MARAGAFRRRSARAAVWNERHIQRGALTIKTSIMKPNTSYALYWSNSASGPWTLLQNNISVSKEQYKTITDSSGLHPFYKFVQQ